MALAAVTIKIMPTSPEVNMEKMKEESEELVKTIGGMPHRAEIEPVAFGLKSLTLIIGWPDEKDPDAIETELAKLDNVNSVEITDVRRAIG